MTPPHTEGDFGWAGFSYAVSALLNARLQRPSLAIEDITHMVVSDGSFSLQFPVVSTIDVHAGELRGTRTRRVPLPPQRLQLPCEHILR